MIGSNMAQTAAMMRLTPNICLYDTYAPGLEGVAEELYHCGFQGLNLTYTSDIKEAFTGASYIVSSGGAARKAGMTREDLLKGNAAIAEQLGKDIHTYCPDVKHVVVVFNPADSELAKYFKISPDEIETSRTYGGHGEQMAVFASTTKVAGQPLSQIIGTDALPEKEWEEMKQRVIQGGKHIIDLRGRSSFQSPAYLSIEMIAAAMGGKPFTWPVGTYVDNGTYNHIMMAMETTVDKNGVTVHPVNGTPEEKKELDQSYHHLCKLRDEVIGMGVLPPIKDWHDINPNIK